MVFQRPQSVSAIFFIHFPNRGFTRPRRRQLGTAATNQKQAQGSVSPVAGASAHCPGAPASGPAGVAIPAETRRIGNRRSAVAQIDFRFGCGADIPVCRFWGLSSSRIPRQTISFGRRSWKTSQPAGSKARPAIWTTRQRRAPQERVAHAARAPVWAARPNLRLTFFVRFWRAKVWGTRFSAGRRKPHASGVRSPCGCAALDFGGHTPKMAVLRWIPAVAA